MHVSHAATGKPCRVMLDGDHWLLFRRQAGALPGLKEASTPQDMRPTGGAASRPHVAIKEGRRDHELPCSPSRARSAATPNKYAAPDSGEGRHSRAIASHTSSSAPPSRRER